MRVTPISRYNPQGMDFTKMQATGNDFVIVDARHSDDDWAALAPRLCHRRLGIGSDGLILVLESGEADLRMRMFNPDGSEAEACGNGLRCFVRYAVARGLTDATQLKVETLVGIRDTQIAGELVRVAMGAPRFAPEEIPAIVDTADAPVLGHRVKLGERELAINLVSMGNPHAVCFIDEPVSDFPLREIGPIAEHHPMFPNRTNFEIVNVVGPDHLRVRVWERGAGETLSCGSGACAVAVAARLRGLASGKSRVDVPGGTLTLEWDGQGEVWLTGPAEIVFEGRWVGMGAKSETA